MSAPKTGPGIHYHIEPVRTPTQSHAVNRLFVKTILQKATNYKWSLQGFGMLRLYLSDEVRLHVWDVDYQVPDVTLIHDHPWNFASEIIAGEITNTILEVKAASEFPLGSLLRGWDNMIYDELSIKCGEGAFVQDSLRQVRLRAISHETYKPGYVYYQLAEEVHITDIPTTGCVTLIHRTMRPDKSRDHAKVYIPHGGSFVSAEPRVATFEEVDKITRRILERYF